LLLLTNRDFIFSISFRIFNGNYGLSIYFTSACYLVYFSILGIFFGSISLLIFYTGYLSSTYSRLLISSSKSNNALSTSFAFSSLDLYSFNTLFLSSSSLFFYASIYFITVDSYKFGSSSFWILFKQLNALRGLKKPDSPLQAYKPYFTFYRLFIDFIPFFYSFIILF
jgi:hypothetical protein